MKWRSVNEKPKLRGYYLILDESNEIVNCNYFILGGNWPSAFNVKAWLDPEVPEEFLKLKEPEKKPCPWCKCTNWIIDSDTFGCHFWYDCKTQGCTSGPTRPTEAEAEAAIFERVK